MSSTDRNSSVILQLPHEIKPSAKFTSSESILTALSLFIYLVDIVTGLLL